MKMLKFGSVEKCNEEFSHQFPLIRHLPMNANERKYTCNICGKTFRQASTMSRHKGVHSNDRPFVCDVCGKGFNRQSTLIVHRKTHTKEKLHTCEICGKGFHQKGNLKNHRFTHSGERPYKCDTCNRGFNQMSNLMCHKAHAHVQKPKFNCRLCDLEFSSKFSLRTHEEYKHGSNGSQFLVIHDQNTDIVKKYGRPVNSARTITLPNGDKTIKFSEEIKERLLKKALHAKMKRKSKKTCNAVSVSNDESNKSGSLKRSELALDKPKKPIGNTNLRKNEKCLKSIDSKNNDNLLKNDERVCHPCGIVIPKIQSKKLIAAERHGKTVFALLKPFNGVPALVKVLEAQNNNNILVPTTAEDLKLEGEITICSPPTNANKVKAVQVKVPVVATIIHKTTTAGDMVLEIVPHEPLDSSTEVEDNQNGTSADVVSTLHNESTSSNGHTVT